MRSLLVPVVAISLAGACGHRPPPPVVVSASPQQASPELMAWAVEGTVTSRRYPVIDRAPGRVRVQIAGRRAAAVVDVLYDAQHAEIRWVEGNVDPYSGRYQRWIRGLGAAIQRRAWRLAHRGGPIPPMPPGYGEPPQGPPYDGDPAEPAEPMEPLEPGAAPAGDAPPPTGDAPPPAAS